MAQGQVSFNVRDALLKQSRALPNGAATVDSSSIDVENGPRGTFMAHHEVLVSAPVLTTTELPDTKTCTYALQDSADNGSFAAIPGLAAILVQTGAGGVGAAATTWRGKLPTTVRRYVRLEIVGGAAAGNMTAKTATLEILT